MSLYPRTYSTIEEFIAGEIVSRVDDWEGLSFRLIAERSATWRRIHNKRGTFLRAGYVLSVSDAVLWARRPRVRREVRLGPRAVVMNRRQLWRTKSKFPTRRHAAHGSMTSTRAAANGAVSRVATANRCSLAMAAISASMVPIAWPALRASARKAAYCFEADSVNSSTRLSNSGRIFSSKVALSVARRPPAGIAAIPNLISASEIVVRKSVASA